MTDTPPEQGLSVHRSEALTDGIYAVAMTLLVIELKLPDHALIHSAQEVNAALLGLLPKVVAWCISFFVLAIFWFGHHRTFSHVRRADGRLIALNIGQLAFVSLMPFSCALVGEHGREFASQLVYSLNMSGLAVMALLTSRHIRRHPERALMAMPEPSYRGVQIRLYGLILISAVAVGINHVVPTAGNVAFVLMAAIMPLSRRAERASGPAVPRPARH